MWDLFCKISLIIFIVICLNSVLGDIQFRIKYSFPTAKQTYEKINTDQEPIQIDLDKAQYIKVEGEKNTYALKPQAKYSVSGMIVTTNSNFWFRDIMRSQFDDVCLIDFGIVWGELASDKEYLHRNWKFKSSKTLGQSRRLEWRSKPPHKSWDIEYMNSHISHAHLIPANANIMGGLLKVKKNDIIKLDGYLVDIYTSKNELIAKTSMSRHDKDATSRGSGACEDIYVTQIQIGNKIYD